jgi:hypothetical protein
MGTSIVAIGGLIGVFLSATLTQWYYTQRLGANGLPCCRTDRPISLLDLGWGAAQLHEITEEIIDLTSRAKVLERELAEVQLTRAAMARARQLGQEGQLKLNELKKLKVVRRGLSKRILGGLGDRFHRAGTRFKSPFRTFLHGRPSHVDDLEGGGIPSIHEHDEYEEEPEEIEEEEELRVREEEIQAELADVTAEKDMLVQVKASEGQ